MSPVVFFQMVLNQQWFCPEGHLALPGDTVSCHYVCVERGGGYRHLISKGQRCCKTSRDLEIHTAKNDLAPNVKSKDVEKSWPHSFLVISKISFNTALKEKGGIFSFLHFPDGMYAKLQPPVGTATKTLLILVPSCSALELGCGGIYTPQNAVDRFIPSSCFQGAAVLIRIQTDLGSGGEERRQGLHVCFQRGSFCFCQHNVSDLSTIFILQLCLVASRMVEIPSGGRLRDSKIQPFWRGSLRLPWFLEQHKCFRWQLAKAGRAASQVSFKIITFSSCLLICFGKGRLRHGHLLWGDQ